jgi:hypothetical protein
MPGPLQVGQKSAAEASMDEKAKNTAKRTQKNEFLFMINPFKNVLTFLAQFIHKIKSRETVVICCPLTDAIPC